jgi:hypothetical protein
LLSFSASGDLDDRLAGGVHPDDDVVFGGLELGNVRQGESTGTGVTVSNGDGSHDSFLCGEDVRILPLW